MKKFIIALIIILSLSFVPNTVLATNLYLPLTQESCTQLLQDVRSQYYSEELPVNKGWDTRLKGLTVTFDPSTSSQEYFNSIGLYIAEPGTVVGCPVWPLYIEALRKPEEPSWTIPKALYDDPNADFYWAFNSDFLAMCPPNELALIGLTLHELGHVIDHKAGFTNKSAIILGESYSRITAYPGREIMNEMFIYSTRAHMGSVIPQYEFSKWFHEGLTMFGLDDIPVDHPFIEVIPLIPTPTPSLFKTIVLQDMERTLMYYPGVSPQEVLGDLYPAYYHLMNN